MATGEITSEIPRSFAIISVLGAPGAGKGTLCAHLAQTYNLSHYSVGDGLRSWMRENHDTPFALKIQDKLDNQGFLTSTELNPFIGRAIVDAINTGLSGILVDGFPRNSEQLESWNVWPFHEDLPFAEGVTKPDVVVSLRVSKSNSKERYAARARDSNDSDEKFERRFTEYEVETIPVEETYRRRGIMVDIDVNGTKGENIAEMTRVLGKSEHWWRIMVR